MTREELLKCIDMKTEMSFVVVAILREPGAQDRIGRAVVKRAKMPFRDHLRQQQDKQFFLQTEEMAQEHETTVAPMALQQGRSEPAQNSRHERSMRLFFTDKQIDGGRKIVVTREGSVSSQMPALATLADLKTLQRVDQGPAQSFVELNSQMPRNVKTFAAVAFKVVEPVIHNCSLLETACLKPLRTIDCRPRSIADMAVRKKPRPNSGQGNA